VIVGFDWKWKVPLRPACRLIQTATKDVCHLTDALASKRLCWRLAGNEGQRGRVLVRGCLSELLGV
jgi:hypothetical protein